MFVLPKHSDNLAKKDATKVEVDKMDVTRYVIKRATKEVGDKKFYKAPKIQRIVTPERARRKRVYRASRVEKAKAGQKKYAEYVQQLKKLKERKQSLRKESARKASLKKD